VEREDIESAPGRSQNLVLILPQSMASVPRFLTGPLERIDPVTGALQLLVLTGDAETAIALAETVLGMTGPAGIELFPVTSARRAARLMKGRPILALAGTPADIADLIKGSHIRLGGVASLVVAWPDEMLAEDSEAMAAVESVMAEVPKPATRIVVASHPSARLDAFVERYLRKARRIADAESESERPQIPMQYLTVSPVARGAALRRLLDDLDPPSFSVITASAEDASAIERQLRGMGYPADRASTLSSGTVAPATHTIILYGLPYDSERLAQVAAAAPVNVIALIRPREIEQLRRIAGGEVKPFTLSAAGNLARERERSIRRELESVLLEGVRSREIGTIEPLLEAHDGVEIAAAALRLLEQERSSRKLSQSPPEPTERSSFRGREGPPSRDRGREGPPSRDRARGGPPPRDGGSFRDGQGRKDRSGPGRPRGGDDRERRPDWRRGSSPPRKRDE
jgi:ATP-dependent RNA helicase DeaD